ncbi:MAG: aldo/keto reductase [Spirochaetaceae bacterium]|nr:MAG: aldo/keto reductase [Spirochaetaceae bacterium]
MEYRNLGRSGLKVSALSFGAWVTFDTQLQVDEAKKCMVAAYDAGVNFFDNAEGYANGKAEIIMGEVLKQNGWRRDSFIVSSKVFFGFLPEKAPTQKGLSRKHVFEACDQALERMQLDYLDLYFCHRPDPETPIEETVWAMHSLIMRGKVLYWGTSEWSAQQITQAHQVARQYNLIPPLMEQPQYNMLVRDRFEKEYAPLYREFGMGTTIWSPLASGLLTGKYNDGIPADSRLALPGYEWLKDGLLGKDADAKLAKVRKLGDVAKEIGVPMAQMGLAWTLKNPNVSTVITGASKMSQVESNMKALDVVPKLTDDVMKKIESILTAEA